MAPTRFTLPDLLPLCPFPWATNPHYGKAGKESATWIDSFHVFTNKKRAFFIQSSNELLVSHCYSYAGYEEFRTCCDFVNLLFVLDEISDEQSGADARKTGEAYLVGMQDTPCDGSVMGRITKGFKERFERKAAPNCRRRFQEHSINYINAVTKEAELRERGEILDVEPFRKLRRENSAIRLCFGLFEYVCGLDLPDEVFDDPGFMDLYWGAVDMVCWSNDVYSYNMEQSKGIGGNNIVTVLMHANNWTIQQASDHIGRFFKDLMDKYLIDKAKLRSFGPSVDRQVQTYVSCMEHWVIGNLVWSFETQRYFGPGHYEVKRTRIVTLMPRETDESDNEERMVTTTARVKSVSPAAGLITLLVTAVLILSGVKVNFSVVADQLSHLLRLS